MLLYVAGSNENENPGNHFLFTFKVDLNKLSFFFYYIKHFVIVKI